MCHFHISLIKALDVLEFTHTHIHRSASTLDLTGNDSATTSYDFENPINLAEDEGEDDWHNLHSNITATRSVCQIWKPVGGSTIFW